MTFLVFVWQIREWFLKERLLLRLRLNRVVAKNIIANGLDSVWHTHAGRETRMVELRRFSFRTVALFFVAGLFVFLLYL